MSSTITQTQAVTAENVIRLFPEVNSSLASTHKTPTTDDDLQGYDEEQIRLMEEVCIVLDNDDNPIGSASKKVCHLMKNIDDGLLHRAFSVFLFDSQNRLLLLFSPTRRSRRDRCRIGCGSPRSSKSCSTKARSRAGDKSEASAIGPVSIPDSDTLQSAE